MLKVSAYMNIYVHIIIIRIHIIMHDLICVYMDGFYNFLLRASFLQFIYVHVHNIIGKHELDDLKRACSCMVKCRPVTHWSGTECHLKPSSLDQ